MAMPNRYISTSTSKTRLRPTKRRSHSAHGCCNLLTTSPPPKDTRSTPILLATLSALVGVNLTKQQCVTTSKAPLRHKRRRGPHFDGAPTLKLAGSLLRTSPFPLYEFTPTVMSTCHPTVSTLNGPPEPPSQTKMATGPTKGPTGRSSCDHAVQLVLCSTPPWGTGSCSLTAVLQGWAAMVTGAHRGADA